MLSVGCKPAGVLAYKLVGPPPVPALYVPAQEPMLVLVENYQRPSMGQLHADPLTQYVHDEFKAHEIAPLIDPVQLHKLRDSRPQQFAGMKIQSVGKAVGASQILYVDLLSAGVQSPPGSEMIKGEIAVRVRVVDALTGESRWPRDATDGYPLAFETPYHRVTDEVNEAAIRQRLYRGMAGQIGRLFHKYKPDDLYEDDRELR